MKITKRRPFWILLVTLILALGIVAVWNRQSRVPEIYLTIPDGTRVRYAGANWGTRHGQPRLLAKLVDLLPDAVAEKARSKLLRQFGSLNGYYTPDPSLFVWFEYPRPHFAGTNTFFSGGFRVADDQGTESGRQVGSGISSQSYFVLTGIPAIPRRSKNLELRLYPAQESNNATVLRIPNPFYGHYVQWKPEPLPATKQIEGISATLKSIHVNDAWDDPLSGSLHGHPMRNTYFDFGYISQMRTNETWELVRVELDDATGNELHEDDPPLARNFAGNRGVRGSLWPDEDAWRVRMWFKQTLGLPARNVLVLTNIPVPSRGATNGITIATNLAGVELALYNFDPPQSFTGFRPYNGPPSANGELRLEWGSVPADMALDLLTMTTDTGVVVEASRRDIPNYSVYKKEKSKVARSYLLDSVPPGTKFLNVTIAVQKMRSLDFYVKPPAMTNSLP